MARLRGRGLAPTAAVARLLGAAVLVSLGAAGVGDAAGGATERQWFCSHSMPWEECKKYLYSEQQSLDRFLSSLKQTNVPGPEALQGRGIVMSGGPGHVLQALANLEVLRRAYRSNLPVEFWHAFELGEAHCEALAQLGAECKTLQVPGVYPLWQTTTPAILASGFREVLWMDTDVTPLMDPEVLFDTAAYQREGALFWPDLWGMGCTDFGQTAWPHHVAWHLLDLRHDASEPRCAHEHEAGHLLVDKVRHWRPLCLAHYLASRDFFTRVLWGYKDVFRLAWLKLNASNWLSPVRPGLVGAFMPDSRFFSGALVHFWPAGDEFEGAGAAVGRPFPLYVHQKKVPGETWSEVVTFNQPLGECVPIRPSTLLDLSTVQGSEIWDIDHSHSALLVQLGVAEHVWNRKYSEARSDFEVDPRLTEKDRERIHPRKKKVTTDEFKQSVYACLCDYGDNRWLQLLSSAETLAVSRHLLECELTLEPAEDTLRGCAVGHVTRALFCSQVHLRDGERDKSLAAISSLERLLPRVERCLRFSPWPLDYDELISFVANSSAERAGGASSGDAALIWQGTFELPRDRLERFPVQLRRCIPLPDPACWGHLPRASDEPPVPVTETEMPELSCLYCCDPGMRKLPWRSRCFDDEFTEQRCCNTHQV